MKNELAKLSQDLYFNKNMMFNNVSGDEAMRNLINEKLGQPAGTKRIDYFAWEENKNKVFQLLSIAVDAVLPAGTLSGAPKIRACEIINELEDNKRGIYGGAIGYIDFAGNLDTCIAIRIAYKVKDKIMVRSGAGVVADSVPESEFQECLNKARAVLNAVEQASAMGKEEE